MVKYILIAVKFMYFITIVLFKIFLLRYELQELTYRLINNYKFRNFLLKFKKLNLICQNY